MIKRIDFSNMPSRDEFPLYSAYWDAKKVWLTANNINGSIEAIDDMRDDDISDTGWRGRTFGCTCCSTNKDMTREQVHAELQYMIQRHKTGIRMLEDMLDDVCVDIQTKREEMDDVRESELQD